MTEIRLFNDRGVFVPLDEATLSTLTPQRRALYDAVADAAAAMVQADAELDAAMAHVRECMDAVSEAENNMPAKRSFHSLWQETFGRPRTQERAG